MGFFPRIGGNTSTPAPSNDGAAAAEAERRRQAEAERQRQLEEQRQREAAAAEARRQADAERQKAADAERAAEAQRAAAAKAAAEKRPDAADLKKSSEWADVAALAQQQRALDASKAANAKAAEAKQTPPFPEADKVKDVFQARSGDRDSQKRLLGTDVFASPTDRAANDAKRVEMATNAGPDRGAQMLQSLLKDNPDPAYQAALVDASKAQLARLSGSAAGSTDPRVLTTTNDTLKQIQDGLPPDARATFDQALKLGAPDGNDPLGQTGALHLKAVEVKAQDGAKQVEAAYQQGGPAAATAKLKEVSASYGDDKAAVDALIHQSQPTLTKVADLLGHPDTRLAPTPEERQAKANAILNDLSDVANHSSAEGAQELARPFAQNSFPGSMPVPQGSDTAGPPSASNPNSSNPERNEALDLLSHFDKGQGVSFLLALSKEANAAGKPDVAKQAQDLGFEGIKTVHDAYKDANAKRQADDQKLQAQLAELKGSLTPEQQQAYIQEFHDKHKADYQAEIDAAKTLNAAVGPNLDQLTRAAGESNRQGELIDVMKDLANSSSPELAANWAMDVGAKDSKYGNAFANQRQQIEDEVLAPAVPGAVSQAMAESGGDMDKAGARLDGLIERFRTYQDKTEAKDKIQVGKWLDAVQKGFKDHDFTDLKDLTKNGAGFEGMSKAGKAFAAAGIGFAILGGASADDARQLSVAVASGSKDLLSLTVSGINRGLESGRFLETSAIAQSGKFFESKLVPGLSIFVDAMNTAGAWGKMFEDGSNPGDVINFAGNAIGLAGSIAEVCPPPIDVAGPFLKIGGILISGAGDVISKKLNAHDFDEEQSQILQDVWKDDPLFKNDPEKLKNVAERVAFAGYDLNDLQNVTGANRQQLLEFLAKSDKNNQYTQPVLLFARIAKEAGLSGPQILDKLNDAIASGKLIDANQMLQTEVTVDSLDHPPEDPVARQKQHDIAIAMAEKAGLIP